MVLPINNQFQDFRPEGGFVVPMEHRLVVQTVALALITRQAFGAFCNYIAFQKERVTQVGERVLERIRRVFNHNLNASQVYLG